MRSRRWASSKTRCASARTRSARRTAWTQEQAKNGAAKMSEADTKRAQTIGEELGKCMASAMTANGSAGDQPNGNVATGSAAPVDQAAFADLPQECLDYRAAVDRLAQCGDKLPADVRQLLKERFD